MMMMVMITEPWFKLIAVLPVAIKFSYCIGIYSHCKKVDNVSVIIVSTSMLQVEHCKIVRNSVRPA